jgi:transposase
VEGRLQQLESQLHKDIHNSHIPPSQFKPHLIKNLREPTGKNPGGQPGHPGHTLGLVDQPTQIFRQRVICCERCSRDLSNT